MLESREWTPSPSQRGAVRAQLRDGIAASNRETVKNKGKNMFMKQPDGKVIETTMPEIYKDCVPVSAKVGAAAVKRQDGAYLRKLLKPGSTVYTILRHGGSGMSRQISVVAMVKRKDTRQTVPVDISGYVATLCGYRRHDRNGALVVGGCGMDMGFSVVHNLGYALWPKGTRKPHGRRNGEPDSDGGYALKHAWL